MRAVRKSFAPGLTACYALGPHCALFFALVPECAIAMIESALARRNAFTLGELTRGEQS